MRFEANFSLTADFEIAQRADMCVRFARSHTHVHTSQTNYIHVCDSSQSSNNEKRTQHAEIHTPHLWDRMPATRFLEICVRGRN